MKEEAKHFKNDVRISFRYSFVLTAIFVVIFIIGRITGFVRIIELHYINYIFTTIVCYWALNTVYKKRAFNELYYAGFLVTVLTAVMGQLWFCLLLLLYLNIDTAMSDYFLSRVPQDVVMPRFSLIALLFAEANGVSSIIALFLIQLFEWRKKIWNFD